MLAKLGESSILPSPVVLVQTLWFQDLLYALKIIENSKEFVYVIITINICNNGN